MALLDDPDAAKLLQVTGADVAVIRSIAADAVNNRMASLAGPGGQPGFSYRFDSLFQRANENAKGLGRREIDGASALIAIAKDTESNASVILAANGFNPEAALKLMETPPPARRTPQPVAKPARSPSAPEPPRNVNLTADGDSMEDMIASVRTILETEELKEREHHLQRIASAPCPEPQMKRNGLNGGQGASRAEPALGPSKPAKRRPHDAPRLNGVSKAPAPAFDRKNTSKMQKRAAPPRSAAHGRAGHVALLAKILENIPRKARIGVPQQARISISREEAGLLFGQLRRPSQQPAGTEAACRAVTVRLTAPEGAFFIEALTHETQWLANRAAGEASGNWAWTAVPAAPGSHGLKVSISARDLDASGPGAMIALPDQTIKVRVGGNLRLALGRFMRAVFLMMAGSGLTITGYYAWKIAAKLH